ncbi:hypothetical protein ISU10_17600 [Nocardioides agariphilus]|jgi:hypothetical protein|uniref:Uncharacterized protein n=1 Tax=Nocardioides agariphilus TaxID=433664 RepID=A0A930VTG2_9ACTN|nr:hypothetical protein [Nocardioides agariphilus]MBF4769585.1 hypothetical protein [Nocardioides agariphilus]
MVLSTWAILGAAMLVASDGHPRARDWLLGAGIALAATTGQVIAWWRRRRGRSPVG